MRTPDFSKTLVVNLYGGPGTGKSTTMAGAFSLLKLTGINVEMAPEFAKDKVWENSTSILGNQIYIFGKQHHRLWRLIEQVDVVITDSPLLLALYYGHDVFYESFKTAIVDERNRFNNLDIFLRRVKPYNPAGRLQTENEAKQIDGKLRTLLEANGIDYCVEDATENTALYIHNLVLQHLKRK